MCTVSDIIFYQSIVCQVGIIPAAGCIVAKIGAWCEIETSVALHGKNGGKYICLAGGCHVKRKADTL